MRSLQSRLKRLEDTLVQDDLVVYVTHDLDHNVPRGMVGKIVDSEDLKILSREEYLAEIELCKNLITIGKKRDD